jgi:hypothetical protein
MSTKKENIRIVDKYGFCHGVELEHKPHFGFSTAVHNGKIIAQVENGRIQEPLSDDDYEWELYEEKFIEWSGEIKTNIIRDCEKYFNEYEPANKK